MREPLSVRAMLADDGPLSALLPRFRARSGQLEMAEAVESALEQDRLLLCEAGTGTGKTLAYLIPAILSGRKIVISTATRALQEQIVAKDLPLVEQALGRTVRVATMKGLSNYVCRRRLNEFAKGPASLDPHYSRALNVVQSWADSSESGDIGDLAGLAEHDPIWPQITSSSETRIGARCDFFNECFVTQMRQEAQAAQIIVVNHHLFFADLALRGPHPASVIPDYDAVVFDEAHQLEDVAALFFGLRFSKARGDRLLGDLTRAATWAFGELSLPRTVALLESALAGFWTQLLAATRADETRTTIEPNLFVGSLQQALFALDEALGAAATLANDLQDKLAQSPSETARPKTGTLEQLERRAELMREELSGVSEGGAGRVTWLDKKPLALSSTLVDLSFVLNERLFSRVPAIVLTSATLTTAASQTNSKRSGFEYIRSRLGINGDLDPRELCLQSPFDFANHSLLYTPSDLPAPRSATFIEKAAERVAALAKLTKGGAFVLTTSLRAMREFHKALSELLPDYPLLLQGQGPKRALLAAFQARGDAILVATQSFWEGVDIPGEALRLVVLEKLPFLVPTDPLVRARSLAIERDGGSAFMDLFVPEAAIALKQGFGRLVRSETDSGIVALLDQRVHRHGYAKKLLTALPPAARTNELSEVTRFVNEVLAKGQAS